MRYDELIKIREMRQARVLAAPADPAGTVTGAVIMEGMEGGLKIRPGQMLIVSGILLSQKADGLERFLEAVSDTDAAGVLLLTGAYLREVSDEAIWIAARSGKFLVTLPYPGEVSQIISRIYYEKLVEEEHHASVEALMQDILYGNYERVIPQIGERNFLDGQPHAAIFAGFDLRCEEDARSQTLPQQLLAAFRNQEQTLYLEEDEGVYLVVHLEKAQEYMEEIVRKKQELSRRLQGVAGSTVSLGVSSVFSLREGLRSALREARKAYQILRACRVEDTIRYYENIGIYRIFFEVNNVSVLEELEQELLGKLIRYDQLCDGELVNTLRVYLENDCCVTSTADQLYVHRNTIKYRIGQITEILGKDLKDVTVRFNLRMAFRIRKYLAPGREAAICAGEQSGA